MALKGNLRDFSTTQLLNLINLARKTGALTIKGQDGVAKMYFKEGKLIHASLGEQDNSLTSMLLRVGKITPEQSKSIEERAKVKTDKELGLLLIQSGIANQKDIIQGVKAYVLDAVYMLFTWTDGMFHFEPNELPSEDRITVAINLESIIMEGSRRIKEWERLQDELPDLDMALKFTDSPVRDIKLSVEEWRVISFINPRNSIRQIAQANSMNEFQIRKIVYGMLSAGLVELVPPEGVERKPAVGVGAARMPKVVEKPPAVKRGVILRLIDRIKKI
ncbi:MAG: DUF4388 domain-containing protein [Anaerolineae bacterium]